MSDNIVGSLQSAVALQGKTLILMKEGLSYQLPRFFLIDKFVVSGTT